PMSNIGRAPTDRPEPALPCPDRGNPMSILRRLIPVLILVVGINASGQAVMPSSEPFKVPVEMMVMDPAGRTLFGHGVAQGSELHLRPQYSLGSFVNLLVDTGGANVRLERPEGRRG